MSPIEQTVATLRRGHIVLVVAGIILLLLAVPRENAHESAIQEVRAVRALLETGGIETICGDEVLAHFGDYWEGVMAATQAETGRALTVGDDFAPTFTAHCPHPAASRRLGDIKDFLAEGLWVDFPMPEDTALAGLLARNADLGRLVSARVQWDTPVVDTLGDRVFLAPLTDAYLQSINAGEDSLEVVLTFRGMAPEDTLAPGDSAALAGDTAESTGQTPFDSLSLTASASVAARLPGTVFQELKTPDAIFAESERWEVLVGESSGDLALPILPQLQRYWFEVERLDPSEAMSHLENLSASHRTSTELAGVELDIETVAVAAAALFLVLLLQLLVHARHLARLTSDGDHPEARLPWSPLYGDGLARLSAWISFVVLPVGVLALLAYRLRDTGPVMATVAAVASLICLVLAVGVLRTLGDARRA